MKGLAITLERVFGLGAMPLIRRRLYSRLERECIQHGDGVYRIISEVKAEAAGKDFPGNWFSCSVTRRLKEAGYMASSPTKSTVDQRAAVTNVVQYAFGEVPNE